MGVSFGLTRGSCIAEFKSDGTISQGSGTNLQDTEVEITLTIGTKGSRWVLDELRDLLELVGICGSVDSEGQVGPVDLNLSNGEV